MQKDADRSKFITKKMIDSVVKDGGEIIQVAEDRNCFYEALLAQGIRFYGKHSESLGRVAHIPRIFPPTGKLPISVGK